MLLISYTQQCRILFDTTFSLISYTITDVIIQIQNSLNKILVFFILKFKNIF